MVGKSLPFVCVLVISYIALSSNSALLKSDYTKENVQQGRNVIVLNSGETPKFLQKRNAFDENGNFDLHFKASTKESTVWFQFTSPKTTYQQHQYTVDSTKDTRQEGQVQGHNEQSKDKLKKTVDNYSLQTEPTNQNENLNITYVGCFSTWEKQFTRFSPPGGVQIYDNSQTHIDCARKCLDGGDRLQVSFIKGGECQCTPVYAFKSELKHQRYCNIPCPIEDFQRSLKEKELPHNPCGGNLGYSVYCISGPENCNDVLDEAEQQRVAAVKSLQRMQELSKPTAVLHQACAKCNYSQNTFCTRPYTYPDFDYFPANSPQECVEYCGSNVSYVDNKRDEVSRAPSEYALLTWWNDKGTYLPICSCVNEEVRQVLTDLDDSSECNIPCPGNGTVMCGGNEHDSSIFATVYCIDYFGSDKCKGHDQTTHPPTEGTSDDLCSNEDIDCDEETDADSTTNTSDNETLTPTTETTTEETYTTDTTADISTTELLSSTETDDTTTVETTTEPLPPNSTDTTTVPPVINTTTPPPTTTSKTTTTKTTRFTTPHVIRTTSQSTVCKMCEKLDRRNYLWQGCAGTEVVVQCKDLSGFSNSTGFASWKCSEDGNFETSNPNVSGCKSSWLEEKQKELGQIKDIEDADTFVFKLSEACKNAQSMNSESTFYGHEIRNIVSLVDKTVQKARDFLDDTTVATFHGLEAIIDKAVDLNAFLVHYRDPWRDLSLTEKSRISTDVIDKTEQSMFHLTQESDDKSYRRVFTLNNTEAKKFLILADTVDQSHALYSGNYEFPQKNDRNDADSFVKLPEGWGKLVNKQVEIAAMSMDSEYVANIMPGQYDNLVSSSSMEEDGPGDNPKLINGRLISLTLMSADKANTLVLGRPNTDFTGKGVEIIFFHDVEAWGEDIQNIPRKLHEGELPKAVLGSSQCAYWNTKTFKWSSEGCQIITSKSSRYETVCECNHLTAFAILMDVHRYVGKNLGLELLTLILCPISELALLISIIILSTVGGLQRTKATITKNLSICLLIGNALVLFVLDRYYFDMSDGVCVGAAMATHYVFLCAFMWMLVEGIQLYRMVVHVFDSGRSYIKHFGIAAYGCPLIVIAITAATGYLKGDKPYGGDFYCWLEGNYIWSFMGPVAFITTVNTVILFIALKTAYQVQQNKNHSQLFIMGKIRSYKTWFKGCFSLTVILGLTWVVGFFTLMKSPGGIVAAYIFTILNSSQGLFIFFFNCILNEKVRSLTRRNLSSYLPSWLSSSVSSNPGGNDGSVYGKRPLSSMKTRESILSEKGKKRTSARKQIINPVEAIGPVIFPEKITYNDPTAPISAARRFPRTTKVDFVETRSNHGPVQRFDSAGTSSSLDSTPTSVISDNEHIPSDNSQSALISTAVRF